MTQTSDSKYVRNASAAHGRLDRAIDYDLVRADIRRLVDDVIRPNADRHDRDGTFPRENLAALAAAGWNSVLFPRELDGLGLDHVSFAIAAEEIASADASTGLVYVMHVSAAQTVFLFGTDDQRERWVKAARRGALGTFSTSEKATGGHFWYNVSQAQRHGEGYLLDLEKSFTTSAGHASFYVLSTRSPDAASHSDFTWFIVDGKNAGIRPGPWDALGVRANHSGSLRVDNVLVPRRDRLGDEGQGKQILFDGGSPSYLLGLGAVWHGVARGALAGATEWSTSTVHKDFDRRLADYQVLRQELGRSKVLTESLRPWQHALAAQLDAYQAQGKPQGELLFPLIELKVHAAEVAAEVTRGSLDVSGGYGYKRGHLERFFRDARAGVVMGPSNNVAREWLGKNLVGLPLELWEIGGE
ncbi:MAG TPA: acyl-CoA dehydrogenase family protein [Polyangiaceae bacterium]|nr:acyl-CoA dehydrogenase family protein [Polyangiaceae bacterium]